MIEYEIKVLDVDVSQMQRILKKKAFKEVGALSFKRYVFNTASEDENSWIRLRTDGKLSTLTYKRSVKDSIDGVVEIEVSVNDFERTRQLLEHAGLTSKVYQENERLLYGKGDMDVSIDSWPHIPPYLEIEGKNEKEVKMTLDLLNLSSHRTTSLPTSEVYKLYGKNIDSYKVLKF